MHCHGNEGSDENCGEELANDSFGDGERTGIGMHGQNVAEADSGESGETKIDELRSELIRVHRLRNEVKGAGPNLFDEVEGGSLGHADQ